MGPAKRGSDGSYSSYSSSSTRDSEARKYLDPWDLENAMYVRGKRISFASDPSTFSAASAVVEEPESSCYCGYDSPPNSFIEGQTYVEGGRQTYIEGGRGHSYLEEVKGESYMEPSVGEELLPSMKYVSFCPFCDVQDNKQVFNTAGEGSVISCEECSRCSSVAPPPPLLLFSNAGGRALSAAGLHLPCEECNNHNEHRPPSFSPRPRRYSSAVPPPIHPAMKSESPEPQQQLAYVYEPPRVRPKLHLEPPLYVSRHFPSISEEPAPAVIETRWPERRLSVASPRLTPINQMSCDCGSCGVPERRGPHARLLEPPRHPCRWGMARTGHVAIDYTNAWMSLARRIKPSRN